MMLRRSLVLLFVALSPLAVFGGGAENIRHVHFQEVDTLFANPGEGWMEHSNQTARFPSSVVYLRLDWAGVEPQEGQYNWKQIDDAIVAGKRRGSSIALRIMTANAHSKGYYSSPKWLFDSGCKGFEYLVGGDDPTSGGARIPRIEPDYADPIYLAKHGAFIAALGKRYDGDPNVDFLDIGSYGIWGEWHTTHPAPIPVRQQIVDMYLHAFQKTPLVFMSDDKDVMSYALAHGTGFRRDGVGSPWHAEHWIGSPAYSGVQGMADTWKRAPIVFEWFGDYAYMKSKGWSFDAAVEFMLDNHVTMINDNIGKVPPEAMPQLVKLGRLAGYRFVLRDLTHQSSVKRGDSLDVNMNWENVGVGKLYRAFDLSLALRNAAGRAVVIVANTDPRDWLPGSRDLSASMRIPSNLKPGEYDLEVALTDPVKQHPPLKLAFDAPENDGWYLVSHVTVK
jgi:hypothetical protein